MFDECLLTASWDVMYRWPRAAPATKTSRPGMMKMGVIKTIAHRRMMRMEVNSTTAWNSCAKGPSTIYACYPVKYTLYGYGLLVRIS